MSSGLKDLTERGRATSFVPPLLQLYSFSRERKKQFQNIFIRTSSTLLSQRQDSLTDLSFFLQTILPFQSFLFSEAFFVTQLKPTLIYVHVRHIKKNET